jgi:hypothetical protein
VVACGGERAELLEFMGLRAGATPKEIPAQQATATDGGRRRRRRRRGGEEEEEEEEETMYQRLAKRHRRT